MGGQAASYEDAALVLLGHGSTLDAGSGAAVIHQAAELRKLGRFGEVREAFWKQEPQVKAVLSSLTNPRAFIVPLFISEGYFSETVIPAALGFHVEPGRDGSRVLGCGNQKLLYCHAVGAHDSLAEVLLARAREVVEQFPFPRPPRPGDITLFIAGHGTEENENSRKSIERQAELIRARNLYADVRAVFLEEQPRISDCYTLARTSCLVVVPFFMSEGLHVKSDIPVMLGEPRRIVGQRLGQGQPPWRNPTERSGKRVWYASAIGTHARVGEIIMQRVGQALEWGAKELDG